MSLKIKNQLVGYLLTFFMLLALLNSAYFFLIVKKFALIKWLAFNACSLSIIIYLICFTLYLILKKELFLAVVLVPLYYFGTMGLFVIPWDAANTFAQVTHIVITFNVIWIVYIFLNESKYEQLGIGLLIGVLVFVPVFAIIQGYSQLHMAEFVQKLQSFQ